MNTGIYFLKFKIYSITLLLLVVASVNVLANSAYSGPDDSLSVQSKPGSLIQGMSREQLKLMVDFLFEMDTIPENLVNEIKKANAFFNDEDKEKALKSLISGAYPASDLYKTWEMNELFPVKDRLNLKKDSSMVLVLNGGDLGDYYHPLNGLKTSGFGWRDSVQHNGIDIDLNKGDKVFAAFDGMVRVSKYCNGFGNVVIIRHYNGLETVYAHLSKLKVKPGQVVISGQTIGLGGSTGHSTGSHLHFEVRIKGIPVNPEYLISFKNQKLLYDEITVKKTKWGLAAFPAGEKSHIVEKGDTFFELAKRYATTSASIKQINGLGNKRLKPGQVIYITQ